MPQSVLQAPGAKLFIGKDFGYQAESGQWSYWGPAGRRGGLAYPALRGKVQLRNAAAAICALGTVQLPLAMQDVRRGLARRPLPMIVPFPGPQWQRERRAPDAYIVELLRQVIGYRVRLK